MNDNYKRFDRCLNGSLRSAFGIMFVDVSDKPMKCTIGFIAVWSICFIFEVGCLYAYFNATQLSISPIYAIGTFVGASQVSNGSILHSSVIWFIFVILFQVICKYSCTRDVKNLFKIGQFVANVYANSPYTQICAEFVGITEKIIKFLKMMYTMLYFALAFSPILYYWATGEMTPAVTMYLPYMNADTYCNFILIVLVQSAMVVVGVGFLFAFDTLVFVVFVNMAMVALVIVEDIRKLEDALKRRVHFFGKHNTQLVKVVMMHESYSMWVKQFTLASVTDGGKNLRGTLFVIAKAHFSTVDHK